jgi:hypothetical protein
MQRRTMLSLGSAVVAALAMTSSGCLAIFGGVQNSDLTFPLDRKADGSFFAWNEITVDQDISSINSATLLAVTLQIAAPAGASFDFLTSLKGETVTPTGRTTVATLDNIASGQQLVEMKIVYAGDLHPLFKDERTIRIEWTGATNPSFTWPAGGFSVKATVQIDVE